jgi:hypothetical protein
VAVTTSPLDKALPSADYSAAVEARVSAAPERAFEAALAVPIREMPLASALLAIRSIPGAVKRRRAPGLGSRRPFLEGLLREPGFFVLNEPDGSYAAFGYVGRPWKLASEGRALESAVDFAAFDEPGYAKVVMDLAARPQASGSVLRTETRIHLTDERARRAFGRYWRLVRVGSDLVRRDWFHAARRRAER